jgi:hypothetical protein
MFCFLYWLFSYWLDLKQNNVLFFILIDLYLKQNNVLFFILIVFILIDLYLKQNNVFYTDWLVFKTKQCFLYWLFSYWLFSYWLFSYWLDLKQNIVLFCILIGFKTKHSFVLHTDCFHTDWIWFANLRLANQKNKNRACI